MECFDANYLLVIVSVCFITYGDERLFAVMYCCLQALINNTSGNACTKKNRHDLLFHIGYMRMSGMSGSEVITFCDIKYP